MSVCLKPTSSRPLVTAATGNSHNVADEFGMLTAKNRVGDFRLYLFISFFFAADSLVYPFAPSEPAFLCGHCVRLLFWEASVQ